MTPQLTPFLLHGIPAPGPVLRDCVRGSAVLLQLIIPTHISTSCVGALHGLRFGHGTTPADLVQSCTAEAMKRAMVLHSQYSKSFSLDASVKQRFCCQFFCGDACRLLLAYSSAIKASAVDSCVPLACCWVDERAEGAMRCWSTSAHPLRSWVCLTQPSILRLCFGWGVQKPGAVGWLVGSNAIRLLLLV